MALRDRGELLQARLLREPDDSKVGLVHAEEERRLARDRVFVISRARPVRRPDLAQPRAGARKHVRDAKAVADLDQLAAGDEHVAPLRQCGEREHHRGSVVVDDERRLGAGQAAQDRRDMVLARSACARKQVVLEVGVAARGVEHAHQRLLGERRASQIRVRDHTGRVEHASQPRRPCCLELFAQSRAEIARIRTGTDLLPCAREDRARRVRGERISAAACELVDGRKVAQTHVTQSS